MHWLTEGELNLDFVPKQALRRKLSLYTFAMAILLLALLATLLILFGRFRAPKDELFEKSDMQA